MKKLLILVMAIFLLGGCAGFFGGDPTEDITKEPEFPYYAALRFFNGAWTSYNKVWTQLPEETKKEWVDKYHTKFLQASVFLDLWKYDPTNQEPSYGGIDWESLRESIENILIQLAIE